MIINLGAPNCQKKLSVSAPEEMYIEQGKIMMFRIKSVERIGWSNILKFMSIHAFHSGSNFQKVSYLKLIPASMAAKAFFGEDWGY